MQILDTPAQTRYPNTALHLRRFQDIGELLDLADVVNTNADSADRHERLSLYGTASFAGTVSMTAAIRMGREGWPEGMDRVTKLFEALDLSRLQAASTLPSSFYEMYGEEVDVGEYLFGNPQDMISWSVPENENNIVELIFNGAANNSMPPEQIMMRGVAIVAATHALAASGRSIGITAAYPFCSNPGSAVERNICYYVPLAEPGQDLCLDTVAFGIANPSMPRRLILAALEAEPPEIKESLHVKRGGNYGQPDEIRYLPETGCTLRVCEGGYTLPPLDYAQQVIDLAIKTSGQNHQLELINF